MKGKFFFEIINNQITAEGMVEDEVGRGFYLCRFAGKSPQDPGCSQVLPVERMQALILFDSPAHKNAWQSAWEVGAPRLQEQVLEPAPEAPEEPEQTEEPATADD